MQTEIEEAKEQAKLDIADYVADKLQKQEDATLSDSIIQEILNKKSYIKDEEGQPGENSFKTAKSGYEIPYSDLYQNKPREEIEFILEGVKLTAYKGETWQEWTKRNQEVIRNTTFGVDPETGELREVNGATTDYSIKYLFVTDNEEGPFINGNDSLSIWDPSGRVTMFIWLTEKRGETITANMEILPKEYIFDM